jgi:dipeptidyl aminopeptidase/acylaminoacyl peptidase
MNAEQERLLSSWLESRDPGAAPASLRAATAEIPLTTRQALLPTLDDVLGRLLGASPIGRPALLVAALLALLLAVVGAALVLRSPGFPPPGLIAYSASQGQNGSTGIRLVAADGTGSREVTPTTPNIVEYSPRWSRDGRTLLFARITNLDPNSPCLGLGSVVLYDLATGAERIVATDLRAIQLVEWSPTGDGVAFVTPPRGCNTPGELGVVDLTSGRVTTAPQDAGMWDVRWVGGLATVAQIDLVRGLEIPTEDERYRVGCPVRLEDADRRVVITDQQAGVQVDLGPGVGAAWSPDDTAIAFIQPVGQASAAGARVPARLAVAGVDGWKVRVFEDAIIEVGANQVAAHTLHWTADGHSIYWTDLRGGHVFDIARGRFADLPEAVQGSTDVQWQPVP